MFAKMNLLIWTAVTVSLFAPIVLTSHPRFSVFRSGYNSISCTSSRTIIDLNDWCDGVKDCPDGSDEDNCDPSTTVSAKDTQGSVSSSHCRLDYGVCGESSHCIPLTWFCDGDVDCGNGFDEQDCSQVTKSQEFSKHLQRSTVSNTLTHDHAAYEQKDKASEHLCEEDPIEYSSSISSHSGSNYQMSERIIFALTSMVSILFALLEHLQMTER